MKVSKLRTFSIAIASLMMSSAVAYAAMDIDSRVSQLENQMSQVRTETVIGTYGANTASANPDIRGVDWSISANVLYWTGRVGGLTYAYSNQNTTTPRNLPIVGETKKTNLKWRWGFGIGVGHNFPYNGWDVYLKLSLLNFRGDDIYDGGTTRLVCPTRGTAYITSAQLTQPPIFTFCETATASYKLQWRHAAFELGKNYFVNQDVSLRPHVGVHGARLYQDYNVTYTGGTVVMGPGGIPSRYGLGNSYVYVNDQCYFDGLGPSTGVISKWHLGGGFSLGGSLKGAFLYGNFQINHRELWTQNAARVDLNDDRYDFSPAIQGMIGLYFDHDNKNHTQHISCALGFETNYYFKQNRMITIKPSDYTLTPDKSAEDIGTHGVTAECKWDF